MRNNQFLWAEVMGAIAAKSKKVRAVGEVGDFSNHGKKRVVHEYNKI